MPMQRSIPVMLLIAVLCVVGFFATVVILGSIIAASFGVSVDGAMEDVGYFFGIGALVAWIGTFKLLTFNPRPRPWKKLAWWTLIATVIPIVVGVASRLR
jgi:uncharacterized membrane protein